MRGDTLYRDAHAVRVATNNKITIPEYLSMHPLDKKMLVASLELEAEQREEGEK